MNLPEGHSLQNAKYQLTKVIGQGGFGITYLGVWNTEVKGELGKVKTDVPVCIKEYFFKDYCYRDKNTSHVLVHSETGRQLFDKFKEKLIKEAKILSEVHHPFIVNVLEVFEENNTAYIAMEHISGCSLKYMLDMEGTLPENKLLRYISQIGQALEFVHQKNILHLDIKPSNILIDKKNNARLIDFGVSKRYDIEQQETSTTMLTLSKGFAPIEQYDDEGTQSFSPCPDIYSLGATMYNLLTGVIPTESILRVAKPLTKPSEINSEVSPQTENAILKAMQVNPLHRYQSVKAMINELDIPSYFEETANTLIENTDYPSNHTDDEATALQQDAQKSQPVDDEQTIVRQTEESHKIIRKKKSKRRILIPLLVFIFAFLGYGVVYLLDLTKPNGGKNVATGINMPEPGADEPYETTTDRGEENTQESSRPSVETVTPTATNTVETNTIVVPENQVTAQDEEENTLSPEMLIEEYNTLLESVKAKIEQKEYAEARVEAAKALEAGKAAGIDITEVNRLITNINENEIKEELAKYDIIMGFGELKIAELRETRKVGAIDASGKAIIPCIYRTSTARLDGNRAFILDDTHADIYDKTGEKVGDYDPSVQ